MSTEEKEKEMTGKPFMFPEFEPSEEEVAEKARAILSFIDRQEDGEFLAYVRQIIGQKPKNLNEEQLTRVITTIRNFFGSHGVEEALASA